MTSLIGSRTGWRVLALAAWACACAGEPGTAGGGRAVTDTVTSGAPVAESADTTQPVGNSGDWTAGVVDVPPEGGGIAVLRAVRIGQHDGFERLTFEFEGDSLPGYHIEYVDRPVYECGSGEVVPLQGDAFLSIRFSPAVAHTEAGQPTVRERAMTINQPILRELKRTCDFEAVVVWVTGQSTPAPFSTRVLRSPLRLVVDLRG